jgi:DNA polymerase-3 subunit epsilon
MVKKLYPEMPRHRLQDLAEKFRVDTEGEHRALADVIITRECGKRIQKDILRRYESLEAFQMLYPKSCRLPNPVIKPSKEAALSGQHCVISGRIETISRAETKALIESLGGIQDEAVSRKTSILILGNGLYGANKPGEKSVKQKKAEQYRESGQEIEILTEEEFFTRIRR